MLLKFFLLALIFWCNSFCYRVKKFPPKNSNLLSLISYTNIFNNRIDLNSIQQKPTFILQFDGGSRGNPGLGGSGAVLFATNFSSTHRQPFELFNTGCCSAKVAITNNVAEYMGLIIGLKKCLDFGVFQIKAQGDSLLVIKQMRGEYKVASPLLFPLYQEVQSLAKRFEAIDWEYIPRAANSRADALANKAMDRKTDFLEFDATNLSVFVQYTNKQKEQQEKELQEEMRSKQQPSTSLLTSPSSADKNIISSPIQEPSIEVCALPPMNADSKSIIVTTNGSVKESNPSDLISTPITPAIPTVSTSNSTAQSSSFIFCSEKSSKDCDHSSSNSNTSYKTRKNELNSKGKLIVTSSDVQHLLPKPNEHFAAELWWW
jgi:ribonuclease HI